MVIKLLHSIISKTRLPLFLLLCFFAFFWFILIVTFNITNWFNNFQINLLPWFKLTVQQVTMQTFISRANIFFHIYSSIWMKCNYMLLSYILNYYSWTGNRVDLLASDFIMHFCIYCPLKIDCSDKWGYHLHDQKKDLLWLQLFSVDP